MSKETWETYEEVVAYLLANNAEAFGLKNVEGKQQVAGESGATWEIDAKGINQDGNGFIVIECKRYTTSRLNQDLLGTLAYRITDSKASGGIIVTPIGLQVGAQKIASSNNIILVTLNAEATPYEFAMRFLNKLMIGVRDGISFKEEVRVFKQRNCNNCGDLFKVIDNETICPRCIANRNIS